MALWGADLKPIADVEVGPTLFKCAIGRIDRAEFSKLALYALGSSHVKLGVIAVYGSNRDRSIAGIRGEDHCGYETWRQLISNYDSAKSGCPEVAEAIKIGGNIVLRTVDRNCRIRSEIIQGSTSPLIVSVNRQSYEVLELRFPILFLKREHPGIAVTLYVSTQGSVSKDNAAEVLRQVRTITGHRDVSVVLRRDTWFFNDCGFPAFYAFGGPVQVPEKDEFYRSKYASCGGSEHWPVRCLESFSRP
jgi:hypothetical protein